MLENVILYRQTEKEFDGKIPAVNFQMEKYGFSMIKGNISSRKCSFLGIQYSNHVFNS